jgi:hypothetical protein
MAPLTTPHVAPMRKLPNAAPEMTIGMLKP